MTHKCDVIKLSHRCGKLIITSASRTTRPDILIFCTGLPVPGSRIVAGERKWSDPHPSSIWLEGPLITGHGASNSSNQDFFHCIL